MFFSRPRRRPVGSVLRPPSVQPLEQRTLFSGVAAWGVAPAAGTPPVVTLTADFGAAGETGPQDAVLTFNRTGDVSSPLTVDFTVGGSATSGSDYEALPPSVTIPAGAVYTHLVLRPITDDVPEASESVELTVKPSPDYAIGGQTPFRVNIQDRASSDNLEDNDTFATASNLGGIDIWGQGPLSIRTPDDVDFFKFTPLRTGFENIRLGYDPRFGDLNLALYDEARNEIARSTGTGNTEFLSFNGLANGRQYYYLKVWAEGAKIDPAFSPYYDLLFSPARTGPAVDLNWANQGGNEVRFPVARAGERREETATIINAGTETLELGQMTVPAGFEVLKYPASSLAPGRTDTVTVWAAYPATPGTWQSSLTFRTNDPERPVAAFSLTTPVAGVSGRQFLDNWNAKDNNTPNFSNQDLSAIDYAKQALLPGQRATVANVSNYAKGINGVLLSLVRTSQRALTAADFGFRYGTGSDSTTWSPLPTDNVNVVAKPFGYAGWSVAVIFPDYDSATAGRFSQAVANGWLEVTLKANDRTGLTAPDVSYYGSLIGDTGNSASDVVVNAFDVAAVRRHQRDSFPDWKYDINRDGAVNALDLGLVRANLNRRLEMITTPPASAAASGAAANHDDLAAFLA